MLEITELKKSFAEPSGSRVDILNIPRFQMGSGEQVVLRGESGCGKTTLLHTISGWCVWIQVRSSLTVWS